MSSQAPRSPRPEPSAPPGEPGAQMAVAYFMLHSEGPEFGLLDAPGQTTGLGLVDLYGVNGEIRAFENRQGAESWLQEKGFGPKPTASQNPLVAAGYQPGTPPAWSVGVNGRRPEPPLPPGQPGARMVAAYYMPHNEGAQSGILDAPGQTTGLGLVNLYEVDGEIRAFENRQGAESWLQQQEARRELTASPDAYRPRPTPAAAGGRRQGPRHPAPDPELEAGP